MASVVGVKVEHRIREPAARHDQPDLVGELRRSAERAFRAGIVMIRLALALDVRKPVRRPQAAEVVGLASEFAGWAHLRFGHEEPSFAEHRRAGRARGGERRAATGYSVTRNERQWAMRLPGGQ